MILILGYIQSIFQEKKPQSLLGICRYFEGLWFCPENSDLESSSKNWTSAKANWDDTGHLQIYPMQS